MEATMSQLRLFVHQRLYAAAEEILGEVEKTITVALHEAEVYRPKDGTETLRHQLANESAAELLVASCDVESGDKPDSSLLQENQGPAASEESNVTFSPELARPPNSSIALNTMSQAYCLLEMPEVKKEQEEHGHESETPEIFVSPSEIVKSEEDKLEMQISCEMPPLSSDSSAAVRDEEMVNSRGEEPPKMVKEKKKTPRGKTVTNKKKGRAALSNENCSVKGKKDPSFCHLCGKGFHYIAALKKHVQTHEHNMKCNFCRITCNSTKDLVCHLKKNHSKAFFCDVCGKTFSYFRCLQTHKKTHAGMKRFVCQECGKTFNRRNRLTVHMKTHSRAKPYHCDVCGKSFSQSQNLTIHKRSHSVERMYQCQECDQLFNVSSHLEAHMRHHAGEKPFPLQCLW